MVVSQTPPPVLTHPAVWFRFLPSGCRTAWTNHDLVKYTSASLLPLTPVPICLRLFSPGSWFDMVQFYTTLRMLDCSGTPGPRSPVPARPRTVPAYGRTWTYLRYCGGRCHLDRLQIRHSPVAGYLFYCAAVPSTQRLPPLPTLHAAGHTATPDGSYTFPTTYGGTTAVSTAPPPAFLQTGTDYGQSWRNERQTGTAVILDPTLSGPPIHIRYLAGLVFQQGGRRLYWLPPRLPASTSCGCGGQWPADYTHLHHHCHATHRTIHAPLRHRYLRFYLPTTRYYLLFTRTLPSVTTLPATAVQFHAVQA